MAFNMKGSGLYGKLNLNRNMDNTSKKDGRAGSSAFQKTGDPEKEMTQEEKDAAIANAMGEAKVRSRTYQDLQHDKDEMEASKKRLEVARHRAHIGGDPEKELYEQVKKKEAAIQSHLNVSPLKPEE